MKQTLVRRFMRALGLVLGGLLALALLLLGVVLGVMLWAVLLVLGFGFSAWLAWRARRAARSAPGCASTVVVEGDYVVVERARQDPLPRSLADERRTDPGARQDPSS